MKSLAIVLLCVALADAKKVAHSFLYTVQESVGVAVEMGPSRE
jgi:hypothetical protein